MVTAPEAAWKALYAAHKDNKKHYYFFQHNAFKGKDKLMALYEGKMATGQFAQPAGSFTQTQRDGSDGDGGGENGEEQVDDDGISVSSQQRRAAGTNFLDPDSEPESEDEGVRQDNQDPLTPISLSRTSTPVILTSTPNIRNKKKRPAEESLRKEGVKRERSSADKIRAGLDGLSARAEESNEIRRETLAARMRLVDHAVKSASAPHELAFEILQKEHKDLVDRLPEEEFDALLILLEQPIRLGNTLSTTSKGRHFCMLPAGPRRDTFAKKLLSEIQDFIAETLSPISTGLENMLGEYGGEIRGMV